MKRVPLGRSNMTISELTLGCMSLGTDQAIASSIINQAIEAGINHVDTADLYDFGVNEELVGSAISEKRDQVVLTTKVGNRFNSHTRDWHWDPSPSYIQQGVKHSLKRLNTDYIDLYLLHGGTIDDPIDDIVETFEDLKRKGVIRAYGISSIRPNVIKEYVKRSNMDAVMLQYNLLDRRSEEELLDLLHTHDVSVLARGPLAKGMLSDNGAAQIDKKGKDGYLEYDDDTLRKIVSTLGQMRAPHQSLEGIALQYVLHHKAVSSAVFGVSEKAQLDGLIKAYREGPLCETMYRNILKLTKPNTYTHHR